MSADHIAALQEALEAVSTTKPWKISGRSLTSMANGKAMYYVDGPTTVFDFENWGFTKEAARFIASANPAAILAVLDEVKQLREELAAAEARADMHADLGRRTAEALGIPPEEGRAHMPEVAQRMRQERNCGVLSIQSLVREVLELQAENEALRDVQEAAESMLGTCGCIRGETPEDEDTHTHDGWAEEFLRERVAKAAQAAKEKTNG